MGGRDSGELAELRNEVLRLREKLASVESHSGASLLRAVAENIPDNLMVLDRDCLIRYINWTVPDLTPSKVRGTHPTAYVPETFHAAMLDCLERVVASGQPDRYETQYVADDGSVSSWESRVAPIHGAGEVDGLAVISSNVTERRAAASDLDKFFSLSLDMFCVATAAGYFKRVNPAFSTVLGYTGAELMAAPFIDFVHPDDRPATSERFESLLAGQAVFDFENRCRAKNGSFRLFQWRAVPVAEMGLVFAVARDITDQRMLESALRQSQKMDAVGQLAGGVAHDFNNLLLAIGMNLDLARRRTVEPSVATALVDAKRAVERAGRLTKQLLAFSRREPLRAQTLDVNARLSSLMGMMRSVLRENIELELIPGDEVPPVTGDPTQIELVAMNLCINAQDAMPDGGRIAIRTRTCQLDAVSATNLSIRPGPYASITVADTGLGIPADDLDRVFEPFFTTKSPGKGTGLGLSTAYAVIARHGGAFRVQSSPGNGATFEVLLPRADPTDTPAEDAHHVDAPTGAETILVAEDAQFVRDAVVRLLEDAGYRVITACDGVEAVEAVERSDEPIALALLDVIMPRKGGVQASREITAARPDIKLLFTTGYGGESFEQAGIPAEQVVAKPYAPEQLLWQLRRALDE